MYRLLSLFLGWPILSCSALDICRKDFILNQATSLLVARVPDNDGEFANDSQRFFTSKNVPWDDQSQNEDPVRWDEIRYGSSSLQDARIPRPAKASTYFPAWMKGYWLAKYKFQSVSFPQGRESTSLRVPGVGLGTCLALPNVGVNPPKHCLHFLSTSPVKQVDGLASATCYEDLAYNLPRQFESFIPGTKVSSIQTGSPGLSPKCFVSGKGCTSDENPGLHAPSTRVRMDFVGPSRRGSTLQTIDTTLLFTEASQRATSFVAARNFVQFNIQQELQTYYREIVELEKPSSDSRVNGRIRVAGFLPGDSSSKFDDSQAVLLVDYKISLEPIDEEDAKAI